MPHTPVRPCLILMVTSGASLAASHMRSRRKTPLSLKKYSVPLARLSVAPLGPRGPAWVSSATVRPSSDSTISWFQKWRKLHVPSFVLADPRQLPNQSRSKCKNPRTSSSQRSANLCLNKPILRRSHCSGIPATSRMALEGLVCRLPPSSGSSVLAKTGPGPRCRPRSSWDSLKAPCLATIGEAGVARRLSPSMAHCSDARTERRSGPQLRDGVAIGRP
jgi:hypothetical protein